MSFSLQSFMIVFSTFSCIVILLCFSYRKIFYNLLSSFKLLSIKRRVSKTLNQGSLGPQGPWVHYAPKSTLFLGVFESLGYL